MPYWQVFYHFIWATKHREPLIIEALQEQLYSVIAAKVKDLGGQVFALGGTPDHVHLVASVPPKVSLAEFVGQVKGASSHFANHVLSLPSDFAWQPEYGVVSFGQKNLPAVVRYVQEQRSHHQNDTGLVSSLERVSD